MKGQESPTKALFVFGGVFLYDGGLEEEINISYSPYDWYITDEEYVEAKRNGINSRCVKTRIREYGWGKKKAITHPVQVKVDRKAIMAVAKANGISRSQFGHRIKAGWDEQQASTTPTRDTNWKREHLNRVRELQRRYPPEIVKLAERNGISYNTFARRVKGCGWDQVRAATTPPSYSNGPMRLKELYGENYLRNMRRWIFAPGRIKRGIIKT